MFFEKVTNMEKTFIVMFWWWREEVLGYVNVHGTPSVYGLFDEKEVEKMKKEILSRNTAHNSYGIPLTPHAEILEMTAETAKKTFEIWRM
jgi:hypothetical protein